MFVKILAEMQLYTPCEWKKHWNANQTWLTHKETICISRIRLNSQLVLSSSAGLPEATGLHPAPYSLQWGLQTGGVTLLTLPPHQQKILLFVKKRNKNHSSYLMADVHVDSGGGLLSHSSNLFYS